MESVPDLGSMSEASTVPLPAEISTTDAPIAAVVTKVTKPSKGRADGWRWTTPAQLAWLLAQFPSYLEAQAEGRYDKFWPGFFRDWFTMFPAPEPTENDPSVSEGEDDDDGSNSDNADATKGQIASKRKRKGGKLDKKKKKPVCVLNLSGVSIAKRHLYRNCSKRNKVWLSIKLRR